MSVLQNVVKGNLGTATGALSIAHGLGEAPKSWMIVINGILDVSANQVSGATKNMVLSVGYGDAAGHQVCAGVHNVDGAGTSATNETFHDDATIVSLSAAGAVDGKAAFSSVNATNLVLNVSDAFPVSYGYVAWFLGGDEISAVVGTTVLTTATGTINVTGTSLNVSDNQGFVATLGVDVATLNTESSGAGFGMGFAASPTEQGVFCLGMQNNQATMNNRHYGRSTDEFYAVVVGGDPYSRNKFLNFIADGFSFQQTTALLGTRPMGYMLVAGGSWSAKPVTTQTDLTTRFGASGPVTDVAGGLVLSCCDVESTAATHGDHAQLSIGFFKDVATRFALGVWAEDATAVEETGLAVRVDGVYVNISTTDTLDGAFDVDSIGNVGGTPTIGGVDFVMDDADPSQAFAMTLFGSSGSPPPTIIGSRITGIITGGRM